MSRPSNSNKRGGPIKEVNSQIMGTNGLNSSSIGRYNSSVGRST
jgi:hypothetical protein